MIQCFYKLCFIFILVCLSLYYLTIFTILFMTFGECVDCKAYREWIMTCISSGINCIQIIVGPYLICENSCSDLISIYNQQKHINRGYLLLILNTILVGVNVYTILSIPTNCTFEVDNLFIILLFINIVVEIMLALIVIVFISKIYNYNQTETLL